MEERQRKSINSTGYYNYTSTAYDYDYADRQAEDERIKEEHREQAAIKRAAQVHRMKLCVATAFVFAGCLAMMSGYAAVAKQRVINEKQMAALNDLKDQNNTVQSEISDSADLTYIEEQAKEKLGMTVPQSYQIVFIDVPKQSYTVQYKNENKPKKDDFDLKKFIQIFKENILSILK